MGIIYPVIYVPYTSFIVHLPEYYVIFKRSGKHYIADWFNEDGAFVTQVKKGLYNKAEEHRAKLANDWFSINGGGNACENEKIN